MKSQYKNHVFQSAYKPGICLSERMAAVIATVIESLAFFEERNYGIAKYTSGENG